VEKALVVSLWLEAIKPEIILWDDFEVSAHPSLIREMLKWLSSKEWQVIISTHSIDVLYRLTEIKPRDSSIILLRKGPDDILKHQEYSLEDVEDFLNASLDPRLLVDRLGL
jgi:predicted ATP-dependent endonuclease of OLD family